MTTPAPGQAGGEDSVSGSGRGAPVPSLQRTVQGSAVGAEFRSKALSQIQEMLQQERQKPAGVREHGRTRYRG